MGIKIKKNGFTPSEISRPKRLMPRFRRGGFQTGFTLMEMLVVIAVFLIIIGSLTGLFIYGIQQQKRTLAMRALLDQTSYTLEYMSRALRMAKKELNCTDLSAPTTCDCLTNNGYGYNYELTHAGEGIKFINHLDNDQCQEFYLDSGRLKYVKGGQTLDFTSTSLQVNKLQFNLWGQDQIDNYQPRLTIFMEVQVKNTTEEQLKLKIQTSVSQRDLDVEY